MSIRIRPLTAADHDEVVRITLAAFTDAGYFPDGHIYLDIIRRIDERSEHGIVRVAVDEEGAVVGSASLFAPGSELAEFARPDELEVRMVTVAPEAQGRGVGAALVHDLVEVARGVDGIEALFLVSGEDWLPSHRLYLRHGFVRVPERDYAYPGDLRVWAFRLPLTR